MSEVVQLDTERLKEKKPVSFRVQPQSFPQQEFDFFLRWNSQRGNYVMEVRHRNRDDRLITKSFVNIYRVYEYLPWMVIYFVDPSFEITEITPDNLGEEVNMHIAPGPNGRPVSEWRNPPDWYEDGMVVPGEEQ